VKRHHKKIAAKGAATVVALASLLGAADEFMSHRAEDRRQAMLVADDNSEVFALQVKLCKCGGGHWFKDHCVGKRP